ncbi:Chromosome (plasmid) partitioning protein ParA (plasmid) [Acidisarcina polymorpha]|uniref:Chromosome (Plasmid) partitioning protein ParA n=1 Tax=Acidisarcina polymorpha TaxID=2211140 RepID=A0A2Z5GAU9_9BACT|nr:ParA family protein [Acidisarcina polymorpha]AXC15997.1 Chromosome (plasmid) partitioning protein ParA [Acidisarcina polymorpha]
MPVIVAANPKGGSGKSTTSIILGTTLAAQGATVRVIDADPQRTLARWAEGESKFREIVVTPSQAEDLPLLIDRLQSQFQFVFIDVQGTANQEMVAAMSRADLVLIPMQAKTADAEVATRAIGLLRSQENLFKRKIPHAIVFMRTSPIITTREEKEIRLNIEAAGVPRFVSSLNERTAFSHIFAYKRSLSELNPKETNGLEAAQQNAVSLTAEMVQILRKQMEAVA